ncbi:MAG: diacylglycerol kinase family lipid kinase [candidate division WOR-3 bacterium]|nr:MAG: diacylglycerol kinase family lipid kinase [candidate division WOR-3 bacterium]
MVQSKKVHAIINPHAGYGKAGKRWPLILEYLQSSGFDVTWRLTERRWHASDIAQEYAREGARLIISVGGEGVMNEIVNGLFNYKKTSGTMPTLAMIPAGTGTDLSRTLHISKEYRKAVDLIKNGREMLMDAGRMVFEREGRTWTRYFINAADTGLGGAVARLSNSLPKVLGGFLTFLLASLAALLSFRRMKLQIWVDDKLVDSGLMTIVGALNGQYFGGGMHAAPMAVVDDGIMEFMYVKDTNFIKFISKVLARVYAGEHLAYHKVYLCKGRQLKVVSEKVFLAEVDGEVERARTIHLDIVPKSVSILVAK